MWPIIAKRVLPAARLALRHAAVPLSAAVVGFVVGRLPHLEPLRDAAEDALAALLNAL